MSNILLEIEYQSLDNDQIKEYMRKDILWDLDDAILICLRIKPDSYNWNGPNAGNDLPIRIKVGCIEAIYKGLLKPFPSSITSVGKYTIKRDDFIKFFSKSWPNDGREINALLKEYKKQSPFTKQSKAKSPLQQEMREEILKELIAEYKSKAAAYDSGELKLKKKPAYTKLLKTHTAWKDETLRNAGKDITMAEIKNGAE